ncbi:MAG: MFS transporter [Candidatus Thermoplasmatota archaeon]|jgi:GPH family glycoside/pentoside/hexuronide:cation symporter|nr:MFS transporter [Candidatus Thermoplasmatota archaeon]MCL5681274.1 MFS transporter [Candidatus Thermoplasmatota archaeon]
MTYHISTARKILYSTGNLGYTLPAFFLSSYLFIYYAPSQGVEILPSYLVGIAYLLGTLIQAVANPFIGNWSDKSSSKLGRRKFFIISGLVPLLFFFFFIWIPIGRGLEGVAVLTLMLMGFNFFFAYVVAPYLALIPEIADTSRDRVRLTTIMAYFSIAGLILASLIPVIMFAEGESIQAISTVLTIIMLVVFLLVIYATREKAQPSKLPADYTIARAFVQTFRNRTFNRYIIAYLFFQFGFYFIVSALAYIVEDLVFPNNPNYKDYIGLFTLLAVIFAVIFSPLLVRFTERRGEKRSFIVFTFILGISFTLIFFLIFLPVNLRIYVLLAIMVLSGLGLTSYFILPNAIISEIIDEDEEITGYRREAMYFGVQGFLERIPSSLSGFVLGLWITFIYSPSGNAVFIGLLGIIAGLAVIATSLTFFAVPLKEHKVHSSLVHK